MTLNGEEFGEDMEKDFLLISRKFCQTVQQLRKGKWALFQAALGFAGDLLTWTEDIVEQWKEH